jgi:hypothetical protein
MNGLVGAGRTAGGRCGADRDDRRALVHGRRLEPEAIDLLLEVAGGEVAVDLGRDARVLVPHDPLHRGQVGALHKQERGGRVAQVVKAQLPYLANRTELELADRAAARVRVYPFDEHRR